MAGAAGAVAGVAAAGPGAVGRDGVPSECEHGRAVAGSGGGHGQGGCRRAVGRASRAPGQLATDGLWARLRGGTKRVVLALVDNVTGVVWPPVVVAGEGTAAAWETLFTRAEQAGLVLRELRGIASDGATGLESYRRQALPWVSHQRCVFHLWRGLSGALTAAVATAVAAAELTGAAARRAAKQTRRTLIDLVRGVYDAATEAEAQAALARLAAHELGQALADLVAVHLEAARVYRCGYNQGLGRASPEWLWRDFRLRVEPWPQSWRRAAPRAGGAALGDLPQLRARSRSERTQTNLSAPRPGTPRPGRPPPGRHQLSRRPRGLTPSGFFGAAQHAGARGTGAPRPPAPALTLRQHGPVSHQQEMEPSPDLATTGPWATAPFRRRDPHRRRDHGRRPGADRGRRQLRATRRRPGAGGPLRDVRACRHDPVEGPRRYSCGASTCGWTATRSWPVNVYLGHEGYHRRRRSSEFAPRSRAAASRQRLGEPEWAGSPTPFSDYTHAPVMCS